MATLTMRYKWAPGELHVKKDRNAITVEAVEMDRPLVFEGKDVYCFKRDGYVYVKGTRYTKADGKERNFMMTCLFKRGFLTDGASAPAFAKMFIPDIKTGDDVYNSAPFIHDGLYMQKGVIDGADLTREECDDVLRGIWRIAGMNRLIAGAADLGIYLFAGSPDHWGDDYNNCKHCFNAKFEYR